jgi:hypothetical protein
MSTIQSCPWWGMKCRVWCGRFTLQDNTASPGWCGKQDWWTPAVPCPCPSSQAQSTPHMEPKATSGSPPSSPRPHSFLKSELQSLRSLFSCLSVMVAGVRLWPSARDSTHAPSTRAPPSHLKGYIYIFFFETGSHYVVQAALKLTILLIPPPECLAYRCVPPYLPQLARFFMLQINQEVPKPLKSHPGDSSYVLCPPSSPSRSPMG